jgi:hypothetical protein
MQRSRDLGRCYCSWATGGGTLQPKRQDCMKGTCARSLRTYSTRGAGFESLNKTPSQLFCYYLRVFQIRGGDEDYMNIRLVNGIGCLMQHGPWQIYYTCQCLGMDRLRRNLSHLSAGSSKVSRSTSLI